MSARGRWVGAAALALTTITGGAQVASASAGEGASAPHPTRMVASQAAANIVPPTLSGTKVFLYDALNNQPLAGKLVLFTNPGGAEICRAVTDTNGEAGCSGALLGAGTISTLGGGYYATFQGDEHYKPVRAKGMVAFLADVP